MEVEDVVVAAEPSAAAGADKRVKYDGWDAKGTPIVTKKPEPSKTEEPAASAASATKTQSESKDKSAAEPETATSQERERVRKPGEKRSAEERIAELTAKVKTLEDERERSRSTKATEPASKEEPKTDTAKQQPATYTEWRKEFKPKQWVEEWAKANPEASYEDAVSALADYQSDVRLEYQKFEQVKEAGVKRSQELLRKTVEKYPDAEAKVKEAAKTITTSKEVPPVIVALINDSDVMTDLLYTLSDAKTLENFLETAKTNPGKAIRVLRDMERDIEKAIAKPGDDAEKKEGKDKDEAEDKPAQPKPRAPKPPSEVGGRGTGNEDPAVAAARTGSFRDFEAAMNARLRAKA